MLKNVKFILIFCFESRIFKDNLDLYAVNYDRLFTENYFIICFNYALLGLPVVYS